MKTLSPANIPNCTVELFRSHEGGWDVWHEHFSTKQKATLDKAVGKVLKLTGKDKSPSLPDKDNPQNSDMLHKTAYRNRAPISACQMPPESM